ncbi:hypothetical protein HPB50_005385 [Hyalomma asiaticum]|uniref:Uncharacterized protein n=1 Tax=Hyalomma asiaticum TaxID=266040 RepID=A0ACB7SKG5_HYAAI|nr:hypothetical protein HPB50_005385 [Hyalomma asiaticum]
MSTSEEESAEQEDTSGGTETTSRVQYSKVLPLKCHIFMLYGSFAAVLPNTSVEAEQLGIAPQLVGAMMAAVPFSTVLAAISLPYFRSRVATIKRAMILVTLGQGTCHLLAMRVTRGHRRATLDLTVRMQCFSAENASTSPLTVCLDNPLNHQPHLCPQDSTIGPGNRSQEPDPDDSPSQALDCAFKCGCFWDLQDADYESAAPSHPVNQCLVNDRRLLGCDESYCVTVSKEVHLAILCDEESTPPCHLRCHEHRLRRGRRAAAPNWSEAIRSLRKAVVWSYLLLRLLAIVFSGVAVTLTDAAALLVQDVDEPPLLRAASTDANRLWGSAGWGAASLVAGHLNYWKGPEGGAFINFAPAVYLSAGLNAADVVAIMLLRMPLREAPCRRLFESEPSAYRKRRTYFYMVLAYVVGSLSGAIWVFGPLRLRLLGAVPQLLAATSAVQVFGGELVHAFASDRLVQLLGLQNAASASILSLFARLLAYGLVPLPWALLPVEATQGLSVGLYSRTTLELAIGGSMRGKQRNLQQVLSTIYHGLGACFGAFVAGCLIPVMEIDNTFVLYSVVALVAFYVQFTVGHLCSKRDSTDGERRRRKMVTFFTRASTESSSSTPT